VGQWPTNLNNSPVTGTSQRVEDRPPPAGILSGVEDSPMPTVAEKRRVFRRLHESGAS